MLLDSLLKETHTVTYVLGIRVFSCATTSGGRKRKVDRRHMTGHTVKFHPIYLALFPQLIYMVYLAHRRGC
jgi:hypothetical protein